MVGISDSEREALRRLASDLTPERVERLRLLADLMTSDPERLTAILQAAGRLSDASEGLLLLCRHSAELSEIVEDHRAAKRAAETWRRRAKDAGLVGAVVAAMVAALSLLDRLGWRSGP